MMKQDIVQAHCEPKGEGNRGQGNHRILCISRNTVRKGASGQEDPIECKKFPATSS